MCPPACRAILEFILSAAEGLGLRPRKKSVRTEEKSYLIFPLKKMKNFKRTLLNFKWRIRWSQPDCSSCPNTPLKMAIGKKLTPIKMLQKF